jgi:hypothetical protein
MLRQTFNVFFYLNEVTSKKIQFENFLMFEDIISNLSCFVSICHKTKHQQENLQTLKKIFNLPLTWGI